MHALHRRSDTWLGITLFLSVTLHVAAFVFLTWIQQLSPDPGQLLTTYYVDVVNLPVASPQAGSPSPGPEPEETVATAPQVAPQAAPPTIPAPTRTPSGPATAKAPPVESQTFEERMAALEHKAAEQRQSAALESLRQKVAGGTAGMPNARGNQAGSDYTAYLHSRLKDAFRETISYQSTAPFVVVRLTISGDGRVMRSRIEKSSGDQIFERAVQRAIDLAEQRIVPPPGRSTYEGTFVFRPQGVMQQ